MDSERQRETETERRRRNAWKGKEDLVPCFLQITLLLPLPQAQMRCELPPIFLPIFVPHPRSGCGVMKKELRQHIMKLSQFIVSDTGASP